MLAGALELFLVSLGLTYYAATVGAGLCVLGRARQAGRGRRPAPGRRRGPLRSRRAAAGDPPARGGVVVRPEDCVVYFLVACQNEEAVIGETVSSLLSDSRALVVVVDDASDDRTGELAAAVDPGRVMVVRRDLPDARLGRGPALNAGLARVLHDAGVRGIPASRITVCVLDARGRLSEGALDAVLPLLADQRVGGVQLPVRIRNRRSLLAVLQDLEFRGVRAVAQLGRTASGTVSLAGNGQFTRLAALLEIGASPWRAQPAEALDLSLALAARGWRLTSAPAAYVSQPGMSSLREVVNERTRWYQGRMQAAGRLRELWSSPRLSRLARLELAGYLLVPWALVLPWSVIFNYNLLITIAWAAGWVRSGPVLGADLTEKIATLVSWYVLSCLPVYVAGFLYGRQERKAGYIRGFFLGHLLLAGNYVTYAACWRAAYRLITGARDWEKPRRTQERPPAGPAPAGAGMSRPGTVREDPAAVRVPGLATPACAGTEAVDSAATTTDIPAIAGPVLAALAGHGRPGPDAPVQPGASRAGHRGGRAGHRGRAGPRAGRSGRRAERSGPGSHRAGRTGPGQPSGGPPR